jgi:hypothetical protein
VILSKKTELDIIGHPDFLPEHALECSVVDFGSCGCTSYRLAPSIVIEIGKNLDSLGVAITALAAANHVFLKHNGSSSQERAADS